MTSLPTLLVGLGVDPESDETGGGDPTYPRRLRRSDHARCGTGIYRLSREARRRDELSVAPHTLSVIEAESSGRELRLVFGRKKDRVVRPGAEEEAPLHPLIPLQELPRPIEPAPFLGPLKVDEIPGYVFLRWDTAVGVLVLAVAYKTTRPGHGGRPTWIRRLRPEIRCLVEVAGQFQTPDGPDVYDFANDGESVLWRRYAQAIGQAAPYWPWNLPHEELIMAWEPGHDTVTAVPRFDPDLTPLLQLAALYPPDSDVARALMYYYHWFLDDGAAGSKLAIKARTVEKKTWPRMTTDLALAARAVDVPARLEELPADRMRVAFTEIFYRKDTLAELVVRQLRRWGATKYFPFATYQRYTVGESSVLEEWVQQLDEVPSYIPDPAFASLEPNDDDVITRRLSDRHTNASVVEIADSDGAITEYATLRPRRLPALVPLAEIIIDCGGHEVWVRSDDGALYPAPRR